MDKENNKNAPWIILGAVIISLSLIFITNNGSNENKQSIKDNDYIFQKRTECMNLCKKAYDLEKEDNPTISFMEPNYSYNKEQNTCFYSSGWISGTNNVSTLYKNVKNCQTNEEVLTFISIDNKIMTQSCSTCANSIEEYNNKLKLYMQ